MQHSVDLLAMSKKSKRLVAEVVPERASSRKRAKVNYKEKTEADVTADEDDAAVTAATGSSTVKR